MSEPLERMGSIKLKLGALVAVSVLVAAVVATLGQRGGVPAWLAIPVTVGLALAVTQLMATGMTSPLREMTVAARRMATGDYAVRVPADGADEVGQLGRAFNQMAADLSQVEQQRRELIATVSHELRTPLTGLIAVLENVEDGVADPDPATLHLAVTQAERLSDLVRDLLDLSRLESGAVALDPAPIDVHGLVGGAIAEAMSWSRPARVVADVPTGLVVTGDRARLGQLLANLLDNATRHAGPDGRVDVRVATDGDDWRIEVANDGDPLPDEVRAALARRPGLLGDVRVDPTGGGTGLGLAIVAWVADLHGGRVEAPPGARARVVATLPRVPAPIPTSGDPVTDTLPPPAPADPAPLMPGLWARDDVPPRRDLLVMALLIGVATSLAVVDQTPGLGYSLVLLAAGALVFAVARHRGDWFTRTCAALAAVSVCMVAVRDSEWVWVLCLLSATVLCVVGSTSARSALGIMLSGLLWPLSALRGLPWLGRSVRQLGAGRATTFAALRTTLAVAGALLVFGLLFASADAVFASWFDRLVPDFSDITAARAFLTVAMAGLVLATAYFALNPPTVETVGRRDRRPVARRFEWLAPVLAVDLVFVLSLLAQAPAVFGNHDYIQRTTGLTYADYTHQGFGQLTVAAILALGVIALASWRAPLATSSDRLWFRGSLGVLGVATLVVVASALHRLDLYQDAYGFSELRLLVVTFELWLGVVMVAVLVAGLRLHGRWLPRFVVLSGSTALLVLALANPARLVADHNIDRYEADRELDVSYLGSLSADAAPALARLPLAERTCLSLVGVDVASVRDRWWEWNLGRARARDVADRFPASAPETACDAFERPTGR